MHAPYVISGALTTIFRPEERLLSKGHEKALGVGEEVRIRIIDKVGADWAKVYGILLPEPNVPVVITSVKVKPFGAIEPIDFVGSTPDVQDRESLKIQLGYIYNFASEELCSNLWITRTTFQYVLKPLSPKAAP